MSQLSYKEFGDQLQEELHDKIPCDVELDIYPVLKNNSMHLDSLVLHRSDSLVFPNFYLQEYYERYKKGELIEELAEDIFFQWSDIDDTTCNAFDFSLENCRERIVYRLIGAKRNQELLEEIPYIPFLDLAVTFYCLVSKNEEGIGSIRISNQLMKRWNMTTQELMQYAGKNTPTLFPAQCNPISQLLGQLVFPPQQNEIPYSENGQTRYEPYVLTNSNGINGAAVWLYPEQMEETCRYFERNIYILPSSIHELLILPDDGALDEKELIQMVGQVNTTCVRPEEILSDHVYYYDRGKKAVCMIE